MVDEANESVKEMLRLKDEVNSMSSQSALASSAADLDKLKSEIIAEKKSHLVALNEKDKKIWQLQRTRAKRGVTEWERWGNIGT